jgi:Tfp pilus assembly protein PilV
MKNLLKTKNRGLSYLEIVIAVTIVGYILIAFGQMFIKNNLALNQSKMQTLAYNWAADKMEDIKTSYYSDISTGTWTSENEILGQSKQFTRVVKVSELESGLKEVEVKVTWTDMNEAREIRVVTYVADYSG